MKITVNNHTVFLFPTGLVVNRLTVGIIRRKLKKEGIILTRKQIILFITEIKRYKKENTAWNIIEVANTSGDIIEIKL